MAFKSDIVLSVKISNDNNDYLELIYAIIDTDISDRWINLINKNNELSNPLRFNYRRILNRDGIESIFNKFRMNIDFINTNYDKVLTDIVSVDYLKGNQHILNDLHEEFEIYGDRLDNFISSGYFNDPINSKDYNSKWPGVRHNKELHEAFLLLNEQIHNFEAIYRNWDNPQNSLCTCLFDFMPAGFHEDLKAEDYFLFTPEHKWGWAYLGYNTLGKHWSSASNDDDVEVVRRKQIRPQKRFAAETYLNFRSSEDNYSTRINLYNWWMKNDFSKIIDPHMKLEDLALGFIPVGKLYGYKLNSEELILIKESIDKVQWNNDVWSKFNSIVAVGIIKV